MALRHSYAAGTRLLVVDDEPDLAELIKTVLDEEGYMVSICTDGRLAIEMIEQEQPAAVILDILMPVIDGFEVLRQLRTTDVGRRLPVILMSGAWRPNEKQRQIGATPDLAPTIVLPKPFELVDLEQCLRQLGVSPMVRR